MSLKEVREQRKLAREAHPRPVLEEWNAKVQASLSRVCYIQGPSIWVVGAMGTKYGIDLEKCRTPSSILWHAGRLLAQPSVNEIAVCVFVHLAVEYHGLNSTIPASSDLPWTLARSR